MQLTGALLRAGCADCVDCVDCLRHVFPVMWLRSPGDLRAGDRMSLGGKRSGNGRGRPPPAMANIDEFSAAIAACGEGVEQARGVIEAAKDALENLQNQAQALKG